MYTQQIQVRNFRVNYEGGFALLQNTEWLSWLIENNSGVILVETPNIEQAYTKAWWQFVKDEWSKKPYQQPILPKFEDACRIPYRTPGSVPQIPTNRFFATIHGDNVAIYDTVQGAVEFINYFKPSGLKEFTSPDDAKNWLNETFLLPMFAISAYVTDSIEYIRNLPLNTVVPIYYRQWWQQHLPAVNNLPFTQPKILSAPKE